MKIVFYPRDIGMFRTGEFDFHPDITLTPKAITNYKVFNTMEEFMTFLREHGVKLNEAEFPLRIIEHQASYHPETTHDVVQWTYLGRLKYEYHL